MTIPSYGTIVLTPIGANPLPGALTVTTDPDGYARTWPKRRSEHPGLEGTLTTQDFGRFARDCTLRLSWSTSQPLNKTAVQQLKTWEGQASSAYRLQDGEGNDWTVELVGFEERRIFGQPDLYYGTLDLRVLTMALYLGQPYTGD